VAPLAGTGLRGAAWLLADHLRLAARAPGELCTAVAEDKRRTVLVLCDLHLSRTPDAVLGQLIRPLLQIGHVKLIVESRTGEPCTEQLLSTARQPAVMDLSQPRWTNHDSFRHWALATDPAADVERLYPLPGRLAHHAHQTPPAPEPDALAFTAESLVRADPHAVTAWLEQQPDSAEAASDLGRAWLRAGQSLCASDAASTRALTLLAALDSNTAAEIRRPLQDMARSEPWRVAYTVTREGTNSAWPGPVTALCAGTARYTQQVLCADHLGDVRLLDHADGTINGRLPASRNRPPTAVFCLPDGTAGVVDDLGDISVVGEIPRHILGIQALLAPDTDRWTRLRQAALALPERIAGATLTAAASLPNGVAFGDSTGHVHVLSLQEDEVELASRMLHQGPVTALTGFVLEVAGPTLVYSGGIDGRIRLWSPSAEPMPEPVLDRPVPAVAISASTAEGQPADLAVAWADGLVEYMNLDSGITLPFRPGPPVRAVCCLRTSAGEPHVTIGMDECVTTLIPCPGHLYNDR
jgi:hypothetical protein